MEEYFFKSGLTGKLVGMDNIAIVNLKQAAFYWGYKGIQPIHIYPSKDINTNEDIIVFVFKRSETKEAYKEWLERR